MLLAVAYAAGAVQTLLAPPPPDPLSRTLPIRPPLQCTLRALEWRAAPEADVHILLFCCARLLGASFVDGGVGAFAFRWVGVSLDGADA